MRIVYIFTLLIVTRLYTITAAPSKRQVAYEFQLTSFSGDGGYILPISFGGQAFNVIFDTGSSDLWVAEKNCASCGNMKRFDPKQDKSFRTDKIKFDIPYVVGSVSGYMGAADLSLNGALIPQQTFGLALKSVGFERDPIDGVIGFSFKDPTSLNAQNLFVYMIKNGMIPYPLFGVYLGREKDGTGSEGRLHIGDIDRTRFVPPISYNRVVIQSDWTIILRGIMVDGRRSRNFQPIPCVIDTGSNYLLIPIAEVRNIAIMIPNANYGSDGQLYIPCDFAENFGLTFGTTSYTIPPKDIILVRWGISNLCWTAISSIDSGICIIGTPFLKNVYSVFETSPDGTYVGFGILRPRF